MSHPAIKPHEESEGEKGNQVNGDTTLSNIQKKGAEIRRWVKEKGGAALGEGTETIGTGVGEVTDAVVRPFESASEYLPKEGGRVAWIIGNTAESVGKVAGGTVGGIGRLAVGFVRGVGGAFRKAA